MFTNYNLRLNIKELQRNLQLDIIILSVVTYIELFRGNYNLLLKNTVAMEQSGYFNTDIIDSNLFNFNNHSNKSKKLTLSNLEYI